MEAHIAGKRRKIDSNLDLQFREELFDNLKIFYETKELCDVTLIAGADNER